MNRRSFLKKAFGSVITLLGLTGGTYYYAKELEPQMLTISEHEIYSNKITAAFNKFKIIQFSDTHLGFHYTLKQLEELVNKINQENPDLIVFTGDLIDEPDKYIPNSRLIRLLGSLEAKFGKYWVYGNHDHGGYGTDMLKEIMNQADFKLLKNSHTIIKNNKEEIVLAGVDDIMLGKPDLNKTLANTNSSLFTILLAHEPDYADVTVNHPVDVQLSGHSHGGQVRFPFIGHLYTPAYAEKYVQGEYKINNGRLLLYVNRGIGTTRLPYRFLCRPEVSIYTLNNER
ncbi:metallophosphoesterase [Virgibacillus halodenitrificans]|uniref:Metallophosphoesterase n=1 Tax=Virgibacillus halodenitrificans TaxID=1482 RepID=A0ABR7VRX2_VIRHA|nr:metallophosphoesterase [Virgibacillus halodenitrificans]MBD1224393.1 metallophosphoesterase [Virgibacillus halodenitrificans]MEC2159075.1 metallophosphoesterase [Virgibacillus halodenitrificans]WHX27008.1 metallophosphoesterase [Virgibacillus halodenitrificans]